METPIERLNGSIISSQGQDDEKVACEILDAGIDPALVMDLPEEIGFRNRFLVIVGTAPTTSEWAKQIGAGAWTETVEQGAGGPQELVRGD